MIEKCAGDDAGEDDCPDIKIRKRDCVANIVMMMRKKSKSVVW